jgi:hypothetical protein
MKSLGIALLTASPFVALLGQAVREDAPAKKEPKPAKPASAPPKDSGG